MTTAQYSEILRRISDLEKIHIDPLTEYLTTEQVMKIYGVSERTISRYVRKGYLNDVLCSMGGKNRRYSKSQCEKAFATKLKIA